MKTNNQKINHKIFLPANLEIFNTKSQNKKKQPEK